MTSPSFEPAFKFQLGEQVYARAHSSVIADYNLCTVTRAVEGEHNWMFHHYTAEGAEKVFMAQYFGDKHVYGDLLLSIEEYAAQLSLNGLGVK